MTLRPPKKPFLTLDANLVQDDLPLEVVPKIFVGSIHSAFNLILNASRLPVTFPKQFTYLSVEIRDKGESNILSCIPTSNIFIEASLESGGVLVHCFGGKSRSPAFIAAYLMSSRNWSFDEAYNLIKVARPTVDINAGFERQLRAYGAAHFDVYVAQQMLLRARIRALLYLRGNEQLLNNPDVKASERIVALSYERTVGTSAAPYLKHDNDPDKEVSPEETLLNSLSTGQKRSWVDDRTSMMADSKHGGGDNEDEGGMDVVGASFHPGLQQFGRTVSTNDQEESAAIREMQQRQANNSSSMSLLGSQPNSDGSTSSQHSFRGDSNSYSNHVGDATNASKVPRGGRRVNRGSRSVGTEQDTSKTPSCRLSRPGSNWVRVIPPLRGLEREFKCGWCNISLFSLANVIRVDIDVLPLLDIVKAEETLSRKNTPRLDLMDSPTESHAPHGASFHRAGVPAAVFPNMSPPTPRTASMAGPGLAGQTPRKEFSIASPRPGQLSMALAGSSPPQDVEMDIDEDDGLDFVASPKFALPLKSTRGGGAKAFDFDIPIINLSDAKADAKDASLGSPPLSSARNTGGSMSGRGAHPPLGPLSARSGASPKVSARHHFEGDVSFASDSKPHGGSSSSSNNMAKQAVLNGSQSARAMLHPNIAIRPSSATSTTLYSYGAVYDDSPRIALPANRAHNSWAAEDKRPQSAEKRRWLARVNLLREGGDSKAAKMADDDDMASEMGFGADKYFHVEYLDWMGKEVFRLGHDTGDICCHNCHKVVGNFHWKPNQRQLSNNRLEAPLFRIHKDVVHQTDWVFDATPQSTPRVEDPSGVL